MALDRTPGRRVYIDWARGLAVLLMIEAHTTDAWPRAADKHSVAFAWVQILGGFAAPLFLWLAGLAAVLSAARLARTCTHRRAAVEAVCRRGLEIFVLAFLFRVQAFIVSPGSHPVTIFRVDILNVMGPAVVATGLVWALGTSAGVLVVCYGAAAATVALITPIVRTARIVGVLPLWLQWYVRPAGDLTTFTIFPWTGFVFAGAACGVMLATTEDKPAERRMQIVFATVGLVLVALGAYTSTLPSIYRQSSFWTSSPTWFAIRVGILMIGLAALHAMAEMAAHWNLSCRSLARFGQNSLFVYWIHVELVYGYASWLWRGRLPLWSTLVATAAFSMLMYRAVLVVENWRKRSGARSAPQAATA